MNFDFDFVFLKPEFNKLGTALGWSLAESVFTRLIDFYIKARSLQFDWNNIINACEANVVLVSLLFLKLIYQKIYQ
jgi:hypothetical protein